MPRHVTKPVSARIERSQAKCPNILNDAKYQLLDNAYSLPTLSLSPLLLLFRCVQCSHSFLLIARSRHFSAMTESRRLSAVERMREDSRRTIEQFDAAAALTMQLRKWEQELQQVSTIFIMIITIFVALIVTVFFRQKRQ